MLYIIEGVSSVGKSTYCKELSEHLKIPVLRISRPNNRIEAMRDPFTLYEILAALDFPSIILDRFYPSEFVYHDEHSFSDFNKIEELYKDIAIIIYLEAPKEVILKRWAENPCKILNYDYDKLINRFKYFLSKTQLPVKIRYSEEGKNYAKIIV